MGVLVIYIFQCEYPIKNFNILNSNEIDIDSSEKLHLHQMVRYKCPLHQITVKNTHFFKTKNFNEFFFSLLIISRSDVESLNASK
jgi:hypothetical protein